MRIGLAEIFTGEDGRDMGFAREVAVSAEELGFDSLWVADHVTFFESYRSVYPYAPAHTVSARISRLRGLYDPLMMYGALAMVTSRLVFGTGVFLANERHPLTIAQNVATLDHVANGRFKFGVGLGWAREEYTALGLAWETRGARLDELIGVLRRCWSEELISHHGRFYDFDAALCFPKPIQEGGPDIVIGGNSPASAHRVARSGDGWFGYDLDPPEIEAFLGRLDDELRAAARTRDDLELTISRPSRGPEEDRTYVEAASELGIDRIVFSPRPPVDDYTRGLAAYAEGLGLTDFR